MGLNKFYYDILIKLKNINTPNNKNNKAKSANYPKKK